MTYNVPNKEAYPINSLTLRVPVFAFLFLLRIHSRLFPEIKNAPGGALLIDFAVRAGFEPAVQCYPYGSLANC